MRRLLPPPPPSGWDPNPLTPYTRPQWSLRTKAILGILVALAVIAFVIVAWVNLGNSLAGLQLS